MKRIAASAGALVVAILATMPAAGASFPSEVPLPNGFQPEGVTIGHGDTFYAGSIPTGAIYSGSLRTGEGDILVPAQEGRAAIGLDIDSRNRLFVAGGPTGDGYVYDGDTGAELAAYDFTDGTTFVNDVVVTLEGAWFTDSFQPVLYHVPFGADGSLAEPGEVETLPLTGDFVFVPNAFNLNGIDATPGGTRLVVVQSSTGLLFTVDPESGVTSEIDLGGDAVPNGDGILLDGPNLFVVQNRLNQVAKIRLAPDFASGELLSQATDPSFDVPTTVDRFGHGLYLVNARFGTADPGSAEYWISRIAVP